MDFMYKLCDELARNEDNCLDDIFALQGFQDDMERSLARRIDWRDSQKSLVELTGDTASFTELSIFDLEIMCRGH